MFEEQKKKLGGNMKKNTILKLICILIFMSIISIILMKYKYTYKKIEEKPLETVEAETILVENSYYFFEKYGNGNISSKIYYETISTFYKSTLPQYYKTLLNKNEKQIIDYYSLNKEKIYSDLTIKNEKDFIDFSNLIMKLKNSELSIKSIKIDKNNIISRNEYTMAKLDVLYENNNQISMMVKVFKKDQGKEKNIVFLLNT